MHTILNKTLLILVLGYTLVTPLVKATQFSGINRISFHDTNYDKSFVGNAFLIKHNNKLYAVTVKHVFLEAKSPNMNNISIDGHVKEWRVHPNKRPNEYVVLGRLLNADKSEAIDIKVLQKDWLVFEVKENHSNLSILTLRETALTQGEKLKAYGCSYSNQASCQQDIYEGSFLAHEPHNIRVLMPQLDLSKLRGLSGSPVLDIDNKVVGIVSNVMKSKSGEGFDFSPANLNYLHTVLSRAEN